MIASVEAPFAFLQKPVKILLFDAVKFAQMPLCLVPEIFNSVEVVLPVSKQLRVVDTHVMEVRYVQSVICPKRISVDNAVGFYLFLNDRKQYLCLHIWE